MKIARRKKLKTTKALFLRTCSKSRFGELDIKHSRASLRKRIKTSGEQGSAENAVEIAAKGRDFEQILRLRRKACLTDRRQSKLRLFHQVHHS